MRLADPSKMERGPSRFVAYWLRALASDFDNRKWWALFPLAFLCCLAVGVAVAWLADRSVWTTMQNAIAFYAAGLAVNAILLAVCWASFSRIFESLGDPAFGTWMRQRGLDSFYGFYVDYIQLTQMAAVAAMGLGLLLSLLSSVPEALQRVALGAAITTSIYAARWTAGCVRIMQELSDHRATFRESETNVAQMGPATSAGKRD